MRATALLIIALAACDSSTQSAGCWSVSHEASKPTMCRVCMEIYPGVEGCFEASDNGICAGACGPIGIGEGPGVQEQCGISCKDADWAPRLVQLFRERCPSTYGSVECSDWDGGL